VTEQTAGSSGNRLDNRDAVDYSLRLFVIGYVILPTLMWVTFMGLAFNSPAYVAEEFSLALLTMVWGAIIVVGYFFTLGRTPRAIVFTPPSTIVLKPWAGRDRLIEVAPESYYIPLEELGGSFLSRARCELIDIRRLKNRRCRIVTVEGLIEGVLPRGDRNRKAPPTEQAR
jgi:hypothetical protein